ncbi:cytochrome ubiquinol oxidase subunit I, partial [Sphingomonas sp. 32-62-10]|uniref:cytochrome ubiquinol oxidase subunit I n=1 Tax=Sphingomonas sp. 32-62-10 TaxID=1970436 RepID=UPI000BCFFDE3
MFDAFDPIILARIQFAFTVSFHFIFPAFSIGLASYLAVLEGLWLRTQNSVYLDLFKFWLKIFAVTFAMGVVSGIVMSYQFGTNWAVFSDKTGPILGPLLAYEVLTAFFLEAGFLNATRSFEQGGMQLPNLLSQACFTQFQAANIATSSYAMLTMGAANLIENFGSEEQKQRYLQPMIEGRFFGTMALTEPHAGSSLSDIRSKAEPHADGSYRLKGNKIFISAGDHPLSDNIVHMVLAKLPDAPPGVKGISLFIVPKFLV